MRVNFQKLSQAIYILIDYMQKLIHQLWRTESCFVKRSKLTNYTSCLKRATTTGLFYKHSIMFMTIL